MTGSALIFGLLVEYALCMRIYSDCPKLVSRQYFNNVTAQLRRSFPSHAIGTLVYIDVGCSQRHSHAYRPLSPKMSSTFAISPEEESKFLHFFQRRLTFTPDDISNIDLGGRRPL